MDCVGNLSLFTAVKKCTNRSGIDKVIATDRLAVFLTHSVCMYQIISAAERVLKLFQKYFSDTEHVGKYS